MLKDEVALYSKLTGNDGMNTSISIIGAYLDGYERGKASAQPDIVRCKDCRYYNAEEKECLDLLGHGRRWEEDDFCSYAER